jgi:hypothetical protein
MQLRRELRLMKVKMIDAASVTPPPRQQSAKARAAMELISNLYAESGSKVAQIEPDVDESIRGLKTSISRQAKTMNKAVRVWDQNGSVFVAVQADDGAFRRRGRPPRTQVSRGS